MNNLNKMFTKQDVEKIQWCGKIALYLNEKFDWDFSEAYNYAENLHFDCVEQGLACEVDPIEALEEDMTYWG